MAYTSYDRYLETKILTAEPVELVRMLYRGALEAAGAARQHLRDGAIRERSREISRALSIIDELARSLDHQYGGEISRNLSALYAYLQTRLVDANVGQVDAPLAEVEQILATLLEGWSAISVSAGEPLRREAVTVSA
jgi:flagellar protein FliS